MLEITDKYNLFESLQHRVSVYTKYLLCALYWLKKNEQGELFCSIKHNFGNFFFLVWILFSDCDKQEHTSNSWSNKFKWSVWIVLTHEWQLFVLLLILSMHILHTVFYTFPKVRIRRTCLTIKLGIFFFILMTWMCDSGVIL